MTKLPQQFEVSQQMYDYLFEKLFPEGPVMDFIIVKGLGDSVLHIYPEKPKVKAAAAGGA